MSPVYPLIMTLATKHTVNPSFAVSAAYLLPQSERLCVEREQGGRGLVLRAVWESDLENAVSELQQHLDDEIMLSDISVEYITDGEVLEPVMSVELLTPTDHMGDVIGELCRRRARILSINDEGSVQHVGAWAPLAPLLGFGSYLAELAQRDWQLSVSLGSYEPLPPGAGPDPDVPASQALSA